MFALPPVLPQNTIYTSHYCEENCYLLVQFFLQDSSISDLWECFVVFISNHAKTVALWSQKISKEMGQPVVWDYHVIVVLRPRAGRKGLAQSWVYDFDTQLGIPVAWDTYFTRTFVLGIPDVFQSLFRVVSAAAFLDQFASDRSHMLHTTIPQTEPSSSPLYIKPPPPYPFLRGALSVKPHNLMDFVSMHPSEDAVGDVLSIQEIRGFFPAGHGDAHLDREASKESNDPEVTSCSDSDH